MIEKAIIHYHNIIIELVPMQPGDVIIFGLSMMHSSAPNRINNDKRYQLAHEKNDYRFSFHEDGSWLGNFYNKGANYTIS